MLRPSTRLLCGGGKRDRTADLLHAMQALYQLSYTPTANLKLYVGRMTLANRVGRRRVRMRYHPRAVLRTPATAGGARRTAQRSRFPRTFPRCRFRSLLPPPLSTSPGRVILVTGASGGLGRPLALACAAQGATLVLHGRNVGKLEAVYDAIVAAGGAEPMILPLEHHRGRDGRRFRQRRRCAAGTTRPPRRHRAHRGVPGGARAHRAPDLRRVDNGAACERQRGDGAHARAAPAACAVARRRDCADRGHARHRTPRVLGRLRGVEGSAWRVRDHTCRRARASARPARQYRRSGAIRSPLRNRTHPGEEKSTLAPPRRWCRCISTSLPVSRRRRAARASTRRRGSRVSRHRHRSCPPARSARSAGRSADGESRRPAARRARPASHLGARHHGAPLTRQTSVVRRAPTYDSRRRRHRASGPIDR